MKRRYGPGLSNLRAAPQSRKLQCIVYGTTLNTVPKLDWLPPDPVVP